MNSEECNFVDFDSFLPNDNAQMRSLRFISGWGDYKYNDKNIIITGKEFNEWLNNDSHRKILVPTCFHLHYNLLNDKFYQLTLELGNKTMRYYVFENLQDGGVFLEITQEIESVESVLSTVYIDIHYPKFE